LVNSMKCRKTQNKFCHITYLAVVPLKSHSRVESMFVEVCTNIAVQSLGHFLFFERKYSTCTCVAAQLECKSTRKGLGRQVTSMKGN
jgi:hypothetical protein